MIDADQPGNDLVTRVLSLVFHAANDILQDGDLASTSVLFGKTLRETIIILLRATSGNMKAADKNLQDIEALIKSLGELVALNSSSFGNKEFLRLFRLMLGAVIDGEGAPELTIEFADNLLKRR